MTQIGKSVETSTSVVSNDTSIGTTAYINAAKNNPNPTIIATNTTVTTGVFNGGFEIGSGTATTVAWIGSETYGWYWRPSTATGSATYDTTCTHGGKQSMKCAVTVNAGAAATGIINTNIDALIYTLKKNASPIVAGVKYRLSAWIKVESVSGGNGLSVTGYEYHATDYNGQARCTGLITAAADWKYYYVDFTAAANSVFLRIDCRFENSTVGVAWFDDIKLEQLIEDTGFTGTTPTPLLSTIIGVTSVDNVDIDKLTVADGGANFDSNYWLAQQFVPTKNKFVGFICKLYKGGTPTGNLTISIESDDGSNKPNGNVIAGTTYDVATLTTTPTDYTITLPCLLTAGTKYWVCFKGLTAWDVNNTPYVYYKVAATTDYVAYGGGAWTTNAQTFTIGVRTLFAKATVAPMITCNNEQLNLNSNEDGLLHGAVVNLDEGTYNWSFTELAYDAPNILGIYSASAGAYVASTSPQALNAWYNHAGYFQAATTTNEITIVYKINTLAPVKDNCYIETVVYGGGSGSAVIQGSLDGNSWTTILPGLANGTYYFPTGYTSMFKGYSTFYIRYYKPSPTNEVPLFGLKHIRCDLDTSSITQPLIYPLAVNQFSEKIDSVYNTARIYYRVAKFWNKFGDIIPHLEFTDATGGHIYKIPLPIDNTYETNPSVNIIVGSTTNGQQVGTGSNDSTTGYILNDGEYMTLSTAVKTFTVTYRIGAGTTSFANITKNVIFVSSNAASPSATKLPSHKMTVALWYRIQSIARTITDLTQKVNDVITKVPDGIWKNWTPVLSWTTATPDNITTVARYTTIGKTCFFHLTASSADSNGCTGLSISLPLECAAPANTHFQCCQYSGASGTTYTDPFAYVGNGVSAGYIYFRQFAACTNGQVVAVQMSGFYTIY